MMSPPSSAIEQTRIQALKEFRGLLHEALTSAVAGEGVPDAFKDAINWDKLVDQTEARLVEVWRQKFDAQGKPLPAASGDSMELLPHEEHDQQVLSEMFVNEVSSKDRERLDQLEQLLAAIAGNDAISQRENPLGPSVWVEGIRGGMQQFRCSPDERAWLLQRLVPLLLSRMGGFYNSINTRLSTISGLPLNALSRRRGVPAQQQEIASAGEEFSHDLVENTSASRQASAEAMQADTDDAGSDVLERLFSLLGAQRSGGYAVPGMTGAPGFGYPAQAGYYPAMPMGMGSAPAPMWSDVDLGSVLTMLQNSYAGAPTATQGAGSSTARLLEAVSQTAGQMGLAGGLQSMPGPAQDMMELVNMLFEALLDGRRLDERARSQLARLVIPYVRVALLDRRMFMQSRHPARRVLNMLIEALEIAAVDAPQFRDLREIAFAAIERILAEFNNTLVVFEALDKSLSEALQERRRGAEIAERRMADAERGRERRGAAMATVQEQMQRSTGGTILPEPVQRFLSGPWQHHQTILVLREGPGGEQVLANQSLVYSLAKACRQGGQIDLTPLRPGVEAVLASSGQTADEVDALLAELSIAISAQPESPAAPTIVAPTPEHDDAEIEARMLAEITSFVAGEPADSEPVDSAPEDAQAFIDAFVNDEPAAAEPVAIDLPVPVVVQPTLDDETIERYRKLKVGDWLDMVNDDGRITAARISWTSPISGRHMLSNRRGQRIMVASADELALMDVEGQVSIRSNDAAFDVALNALADRLTRTAGTLTTT